MLYAACLTLLHKVIHNAPSLVHVGGNGVFVYVVQQIKVEVLHAALFQLFLEGGGRVIMAADLMAGILVRQIPALSGVAAESLAYGDLGSAAVVGSGSVKVVYTVGESVVHHLIHGFLVNAAVFQHRQSHSAKAQCRQGKLLEFFVYHKHTSLLFSDFNITQRKIGVNMKLFTSERKK